MNLFSKLIKNVTKLNYLFFKLLSSIKYHKKLPPFVT